VGCGREGDWALLLARRRWWKCGVPVRCASVTWNRAAHGQCVGDCSGVIITIRIKIRKNLILVRLGY
jgi:hypothetical protein